LTLVKFAIPKGSIEDATFKVLEKSWTKVSRRDRTYRVTLDDPQIIVKMLKKQTLTFKLFWIWNMEK
jgi:ATP phosphoribosyltransferase